MDCARHIEMETGEINDFLRRHGARIGKRQIEVYQREQQEAVRLAEMYALQQQQQEEDIKEPPGSLKLDKGGKSLKKQKKTKNQKKSNKKRKTRKQRKTRKYK
jgi:hypothetical protein